MLSVALTFSNELRATLHDSSPLRTQGICPEGTGLAMAHYAFVRGEAKTASAGCAYTHDTHCAPWSTVLPSSQRVAVPVQSLLFNHTSLIISSMIVNWTGHPL